MEDAKTVDAKELDLVDNASKVQVQDKPLVEETKHSDSVKENPMPSQQEEAVIKKKYGGLLPKKNPLISKDHERAFFDSADWALGKGAQKSKGPLEALRPKLQPTHHQQARSRRSGRSAYAPAGEGEDVDNTAGVPSEDGGSNDDAQPEDITHHN
ncbi:Endosulphine [Heracleum sosnowskyi]|uniref:Endosulphine n=1 Tax=Heracleum sosnowskyi TaxID=360622 RepID=A0AAD8I687_9APIA|nr:Endosulphine [Heracleum sosnowskyi]